jgi:hypothetical protein
LPELQISGAQLVSCNVGRTHTQQHENKARASRKSV